MLIVGLGRSGKEKQSCHKFACYAERVAAMEVEVFVVDIKGAADADLAGLINPLLHCFQNCVFNVNVWALPAVEVRHALQSHTSSRRSPTKPGQPLTLLNDTTTFTSYSIKTVSEPSCCASL